MALGIQTTVERPASSGYLRRLLTGPLARIWPPALAGALAALVPAAYLAAGHAIAWRDSTLFFTPLRALVEPALRSLRLPLWNPHEALGQPLFAQLNHAVLHPVSLLGAWLLPGAGPDLAIVAFVFLAAAGAAVASLQLGATAPAAVLGGLAYGLSGYVLGMSAILVYLCAGATAPWVVAGLLQLGRGGPGRLAVGAVAVAVMHLAGDPQWTVVACALGVMLAWQRHGLAVLPRLLLAMALGTGLAALQLAPTALVFGETARATGLSASDQRQWAFPPWRVVELASPGFFGGVLGQLEWPVFRWLGDFDSATVMMPCLPSVYVGAVPLVLAAAALRADRTARLLGLLALVFLWLALGHHFYAQSVVERIPIWGSFRYAEKLIGPLTLCLALAAARGLDALPWPRPRLAWSLAAAAAAFLAGAALLAVDPSLVPHGAGATATAGAAQAARNLSAGLLHLGLATSLLALVLGRGARWSEPARRWSLTGLLLVAAVGASPFSLHAGQPGLLDLGVMTSLPREAPAPRIMTPLEEGGHALQRGPHPVDALLLAQSRLGEVPFPAMVGVDQVGGYAAMPARPWVEVRQLLASSLGTEQWVALRRFGVTHAVVQDPYTDQEKVIARSATRQARFLWHDRDRHLSVWALPHRPWASFAAEVWPARDEVEALRLLGQAVSAGSEAVVVERPPADLAAGGGRVLRVARGTEEAEVEAESDGPGLLVVNEALLSGWSATIDGAPAPLLRADRAVRAVAWPPGRHLLRMHYEAPGLRLGLWVSSASALILLALAALALAPAARRGSTA